MRCRLLSCNFSKVNEHQVNDVTDVHIHAHVYVCVLLVTQLLLFDPCFTSLRLSFDTYQRALYFNGATLSIRCYVTAIIVTNDNPEHACVPFDDC